MARAPQQEIEPVRRRMAWTVPWYSSYGTTFNDDMGLTAFGLSVLLRDGDEVFRTYFTTARRRPVAAGLQPAGPDAVRAAGGAGGLTGRLARARR